MTGISTMSTFKDPIHFAFLDDFAQILGLKAAHNKISFKEHADSFWNQGLNLLDADEVVDLRHVFIYSIHKLVSINQDLVWDGHTLQSHWTTRRLIEAQDWAQRVLHVVFMIRIKLFFYVEQLRKYDRQTSNWTIWVMFVVVLKLAQSRIICHGIRYLAKHGDFINEWCTELLKLKILNFKLIALFHRQPVVCALVLQVEFGNIRWISYANLVSQPIEFKTVESREVLAQLISCIDTYVLWYFRRQNGNYGVLAAQTFDVRIKFAVVL